MDPGKILVGKYYHYLFDRSGCPIYNEFLSRMDTVSKIKVDKVLIWNTYFGSQTFEVLNNIYTKSKGNLLFQVFCVGIFAAFHF